MSKGRHAAAAPSAAARARGHRGRLAPTAVAALAAAALLAAGIAPRGPTADAATPAGSFALDFESAVLAEAYRTDNCVERPGLATTTSGVIAGTRSGRTGVLTPTAYNDMTTPWLQVIPGTTEIHLRQYRSGGGAGNALIRVVATDTTGTVRQLDERVVPTTATNYVLTLPADLPERVRLTILWRDSVANTGKRVVFDTLAISPVRQATVRADAAGAAGTAACAVEVPAAVALTGPSPFSFPAGHPATLPLQLTNPNQKPLTLEADVTVPVPAPLAAAAVTGTCPAVLGGSPGSPTVTVAAGTVVPAGGCTVDLDVTALTAATVSADLAAGAVTTEAGASAAVSIPVVVEPPPPPTAGDDAVTVVAAGTATIPPLANDSPAPYRTLVPGSVDLDSAAPGRQVAVTIGSLVLTVDGTGVLTARSTATGPPLGPAAMISYTVADDLGTVSAPALVVVTEAPPPPPAAADDDVAVPAGGEATVDLRANDSATPPATLVAGVDLDPATPGPQTDTTAGAFTVRWTGPGGRVAVTSASTGPPLAAPVDVTYRVEDDYGRSADAVLTLREGPPPAPTAGPVAVSVVVGRPATATVVTGAAAPAALAPDPLDLQPGRPGQQRQATVGAVEAEVAAGTRLDLLAAEPGRVSLAYTVRDDYGTVSAPGTVTVVAVESIEGRPGGAPDGPVPGPPATAGGPSNGPPADRSTSPGAGLALTGASLGGLVLTAAGLVGAGAALVAARRRPGPARLRTRRRR